MVKTTADDLRELAVWRGVRIIEGDKCQVLLSLTGSSLHSLTAGTYEGVGRLVLQATALTVRETKVVLARSRRSGNLFQVDVVQA